MNYMIRYVLATLVMIVLLCSCEDYLEVDSKGVVNEKEMFKDVNGFKDALGGIYASLGSKALYGENLSHGLIDYMGQYFSERSNSYGTLLGTASKLEYEEQIVKKQTQSLWLQAYFVIATTNNFLQHIEDTEITGFAEKEQMKAEALAIRAFLHFDLLRLFGGFFPEDKDKRGIAFSTDFSKNPPRFYTNQEVLAKIIADLDSAEQLLAKQSVELDVEEVHFDSEAVWALKARIYNYIHQYDRAIEYANKVLKSGKLYLANRENYKYLHRSFLAKNSPKATKFNECVLGIFTESASKVAAKKFDASEINVASTFARADYEEVFLSGPQASSLEDIRFNDGFEVANSGVHFTKFKSLDKEEKRSFINSGRLQGINLMRLPEMYYILANAYYNQDKNKAAFYLNIVMRKRGLLGLSVDEIATREEFERILLSEIQKEYWGEGQLFFAHKSLRADLQNSGKEVFHADARHFIVPIPQEK